MGLHTKTYKKTHRTPFHFKMHLLGPKWVKFEPERCILKRKCVKKRKQKNGGRFLLANQYDLTANRSFRNRGSSSCSSTTPLALEARCGRRNNRKNAPLKIGGSPVLFLARKEGRVTVNARGHIEPGNLSGPKHTAVVETTAKNAKKTWPASCAVLALKSSRRQCVRSTS